MIGGDNAPRVVFLTRKVAPTTTAAPGSEFVDASQAQGHTFLVEQRARLVSLLLQLQEIKDRIVSNGGRMRHNLTNFPVPLPDWMLPRFEETYENELKAVQIEIDAMQSAIALIDQFLVAPNADTTNEETP